MLKCSDTMKFCSNDFSVIISTEPAADKFIAIVIHIGNKINQVNDTLVSMILSISVSSTMRIVEFFIEYSNNKSRSCKPVERLANYNCMIIIYCLHNIHYIFILNFTIDSFIVLLYLWNIHKIDFLFCGIYYFHLFSSLNEI